jgi:tetratricopeptide (TPR) repeat protein
VFAVSAQNLFDFGLELAGLGGVASVALGTLLVEESPRGWLVRVRRPALRIGLVSAVGVAALALLLALPTLTYASREVLVERLGQQHNAKNPQFSETLSRALALYPRDARVIEAGTRRAVASNAPNAARWLNLALSTTPSRPTPHALAAWYLERRGRLDQAALELALAVETDRSMEAYSCAFVQHHPLPELAWSLSPVEPAKQRASIEYLARCMSAAGHQAPMVELLTGLIARDPAARDAYLALIQEALQSRQIERALALQAQMQRNLPIGPETVAVTVHTLTAAGKPDLALRAYDDAPSSLRLHPQVMWSAAPAAAALKQVDRLEALYAELIAQAPNAGAAADIQDMASVHLEQAEAVPAALAHAQAAYELNGDPQRLEHVYQLATRAGFAQVALRASLGLCHLSVRGKYYCQHAP